MHWLTSPAHARWLESETDRLLEFGRGALDPAGGFGWLGDDGRREPGRPRQLWITCRMVHVFALGHLLGRPGWGPLADHGVRALETLFHDERHSGWYAGVGEQGPVTTAKTAYEHAFVVLAGASATVAGRPGGEELLAEALRVLDEHFWDERHGMVVEEWDESFTTLDGYRGLNANMHTVEALLAAYDVTGDRLLVERALRITTRAVHELAPTHEQRLPEHFDADWRPLLELNAEEPAHPFRPYGATIGHSFEWSRLALHLDAALGAAAPEWLRRDAVALFEAAVADGWAADGADGFVYTVDWSGAPVVRQRMHWVAAEAVAAAAAVWTVTGEDRYAELYASWWDHVAARFIDRVGGSWRHELGPDLEPSAMVWTGKPDVYHALQATLLPRLPLAPTLAVALRDGRLPPR